MVKRASATSGSSLKRGPLTHQEVLDLPAAVDLVTAGRALGLSRESSYNLARAGEFPVPTLRAGSRWIVPRAGLLKALGIDG